MKGASGQTVPADYFKTLFSKERDPWNLETSDYERAKYERTLAALPQERYARGLELGCAIGVFTALLGGRCDRLLAVDASPDAVAVAADRCAALPGVHFACLDLARAFPEGNFDLIAFCELGYYFAPDDLERIGRNMVAGLVAGGTLVMVHWTPLAGGHAMTADDVHTCIGSLSGLERIDSLRSPTYLLEVFRRT